jgi:predicted Zn-dependent protease
VQFDRETAQPKTGNNPANGPLTEVSGHVLKARIAIAENDTAAATRELEAALKISDERQMQYGDPPAVEPTVRYLLGAHLLRAGQAAEAIPVLKQAILDTPNNAWALYALKEASARTGDPAAAAQYEKLFVNAWAGQGTPDLDRI